MGLSEADKTFVVATESMDERRDREAIYAAYRKTHPEAAGLSNKQVAWRIKQMPKDEVADALAEAGATATAARRRGVAERNKAIFDEQATLARINEKLLLEVEAVMDLPISLGDDGVGISAAAKQKWADLANKVVASRKQGGGVDPSIAKALAERRKQLEAEKARIEGVGRFEATASAAPPASQQVSLMVEPHGRA